MRRVERFLLIVLGLCALADTSTSAQTLAERRAKVLARGLPSDAVVPAVRVTTASIAVPVQPLPVPSIRIRLRLVQEDAGPWAVLVEGANGSQRVTQSMFTNQEYWTDILQGGSVRVRLESAAAAQVDVDRVSGEQVLQHPQAIIGPDDSREITHNRVPPQVKQWAPAIARLLVVVDGESGFCSGFLLGADLLMTNQHCISSAAEAASAVVQFGFDATGATITSFRVRRLLAADADLDYALVRLAGDASKFGRIYVGLKAATTMPLALIQHPQGQPKRAAFDPNCNVGSTSVAGVNNALNDFGHTCDTLGGSSGSPVVHGDNGLLVGLHHWRWPLGAKLPENQAVHIDKIVAEVTSRAAGEKNPALKQDLEQAVKELTKAPPSP